MKYKINNKKNKMQNKQIKQKIKISEFIPSNFDKKDTFFIEIPKYIKFFPEICLNNNLTLNENDTKLINDKIISIKEFINKNSDDNFDVIKEFANNLCSWTELSKENSKYALEIKNIIDLFKGERFSLKSIQNKYSALYNKNISKMTISRVLRYHLNYHYRKTKPKNPKLL